MTFGLSAWRKLSRSSKMAGKNRTAARSTKLMTGGSECRDRKWNMSPPFAVTRNEVFRRRHHEGTLPSIGHPFAPAGVGTASAPAQIWLTRMQKAKESFKMAKLQPQRAAQRKVTSSC